LALVYTVTSNLLLYVAVFTQLVKGRVQSQILVCAERIKHIINNNNNNNNNKCKKAFHYVLQSSLPKNFTARHVISVFRLNVDEICALLG
jgi:hypothetical protein